MAEKLKWIRLISFIINMNSFIAKLLKKNKVESIDELDDEPMPDGSPTEKVTFQQWEATLSKPDITVADIKKFCETQVEIIEGKWRDFNTENVKKAELIPYHTVYRALASRIDAPQAEREQLEKHLIQLINK